MSNKETVEEYLARGGYVKVGITKYNFIDDHKKFIPDNDQIKDFYQSQSWKNLKKGFNQKCYREGKFYCQTCGCIRPNMMRIDHIRSVRYNWELRLDESNLQILCSKCNRDKKTTEYRANGLKKCNIGCTRCLIKSKKADYSDEVFCSERGILDWLSSRDQDEIDEYLKSQIALAEENLKKYYEQN